MTLKYPVSHLSSQTTKQESTKQESNKVFARVEENRRASQSKN
ncbi:22053_t:CDS:2 [Cetraspora pellucida]|uniref:22053_t:CDS:1 n=1 Tax=Cetraspora pellucida TaxID=1433469 RepID=A0A9N9EA89_9GLOM|nr:22053_t:CDS:2 [Cetraspora pellucida]